MAAGTSRSRSRSKIGPPVEMDHGFLQKRAHQTAGGPFPPSLRAFPFSKKQSSSFQLPFFFLHDSTGGSLLQPPGGRLPHPPPGGRRGAAPQALACSAPPPPSAPSPRGGGGGRRYGSSCSPQYEDIPTQRCKTRPLCRNPGETAPERQAPSQGTAPPHFSVNMGVER